MEDNTLESALRSALETSSLEDAPTLVDNRPPPAAAKRPRGFATWDPAKQREAARLGGKKAHALGRGHQWTSEEAKAAGRKGGLAISADRAYMARIGKIGGKA